MEFINNTPSPALSFEGVDAQQEFHVVVTRQTYTWNETGLLRLADQQDPLCMTDELVDPDDIMSGVLQESDLCHYKPKCDVILIGSAYAPQAKKVKNFTASIQLKTPDKVIFSEPIKSTKYQFQELQQKPIKPKISRRIKGDILIDKTLVISGKQYITNINETITGNYQLFSGDIKKNDKVSLNPSSSLGGHCLLDNDHPNLDKIATDKLIPEKERRVMPTKGHSAPIAYFSQDNCNPYGTGYLTREYIKAVGTNSLTEAKIAIAQVQYQQYPITDVSLSKLVNGKLDEKQHSKMVAGFGICAKSHPDRYQYMGKIDDEYLKRIEEATDARQMVPEGFDFAIWNCAYPDQQTEHLKGNEWISLTNLCQADIPAAKITGNGDTKLTLYLPESLVTLITQSKYDNYPDAEVPMKIDTIAIHPDEKKVNIVWRGIIASSYEAEVILLEYVSPEKHHQLLQQYFTQKGDIVRPYEGAQL